MMAAVVEDAELLSVSSAGHPKLKSAVAAT